MILKSHNNFALNQIFFSQVIRVEQSNETINQMSRPINLQQGEGQSREILLLIKPAQYWVIKIFMLTKIVYLDN